MSDIDEPEEAYDPPAWLRGAKRPLQFSSVAKRPRPAESPVANQPRQVMTPAKPAAKADPEEYEFDAIPEEKLAAMEAEAAEKVEAEKEEQMHAAIRKASRKAVKEQEAVMVMLGK